MRLNGFVARERKVQERLVEGSWMTAKLSRAKRVPPLRRLLSRARGRRRGHDDLVRARDQQRRLSQSTVLPSNWRRIEPADLERFEAHSKRSRGRRRRSRSRGGED